MITNDTQAGEPALKLVKNNVVNIAGSNPFYQVADSEYDYAFMIDFEMANGNAVVLPYGYFISAHLQHNEKLHIKFNNWEVVIKGRELKPIYKALVTQKLKFIRMALAGEKDNSEYTSFVSDIKFLNVYENIETDTNSAAGNSPHRDVVAEDLLDRLTDAS